MAQTSLQSLLLQQFSTSGKTGALNTGSAPNSTFNPGPNGKGNEFARTLESRLEVQRDRGPAPAAPSPTPQQASRPAESAAEPAKSSENTATRKPQEQARSEKNEPSRRSTERSESKNDNKNADASAADKAAAEGSAPRPSTQTATDESTSAAMSAEQPQDHQAPQEETSSSEIAANLGLAGLPAALAAALERLPANAPAGDTLDGGVTTSGEVTTANAPSLDLTQLGGGAAQTLSTQASPSDPDPVQPEPSLAQDPAAKLQPQTLAAATAAPSLSDASAPSELPLSGEDSASRLLAARERSDTSLLPDSASTVAKAVREAISEFTGQRDSSQQGWGGQPQNLLNFAAQLAARNGEASGPKFADLATAPIAGTDAGITDGNTAAQALPHPLLNPRSESASRPSPVMHMNTAAFESGWAEELGSKVGVLFRAEESRAELVLNPAKLGRIEITLTMNGEQASAQFLAATPAAREALEQAMPRLREVLQQAGIMLADSQVDTASQQQAQQEQQARQGRRPPSDEGLPLDEPLVRAGNVWIRPGEGRVDIFA